MDQSSQTKISLFKSLFRGREDIFAQRWEKGGKASYSPQYDYDPYQYRLHKMKGGTMIIPTSRKDLSFGRICWKKGCSDYTKKQI
jgi:hypothetical protein